MTTGSPAPGAHPRVLLRSAVEHLGEPAVMAWCVRLIHGEERRNDPDLALLGGSEDWPPYWRRVWGTRGLLYVGDGRDLDAVSTALGDEHWRVREMACKVARAHRLVPLSAELAALRDDDNARVRAAADRALVSFP